METAFEDLPALRGSPLRHAVVTGLPHLRIFPGPCLGLRRQIRRALSFAILFRNPPQNVSSLAETNRHRLFLSLTIPPAAASQLMTSETSPTMDTTATSFPVAWCRSQFPALARQHNGRNAVFFDGPAGSQTPECVIDAIGDYLRHTNANHGGVFATSRESDALLEGVHSAVADLLGAPDPDCVVFGANMTTLAFHLSRTLARIWQTGDEIIVTQLDHDANVTPWVLAARDAGATIRHLPIHPGECTLDLDALSQLLTTRTRLVAVGAASNAVGTVNPIATICRMAHAVGAEVAVDAVHFAPHRLIDVAEWGCDWLLASAYKFFGPHIGILWGHRHRLESLECYKVRPATNTLPGKWMTGTQNHECLAGVGAAVEYLATLGRQIDPSAVNRRVALRVAYTGIAAHERVLTSQFLSGVAALPAIHLFGSNLPNSDHRVATFGLRHTQHTPATLAQSLSDNGIFTWHGNFYALPLTEALALEPDGLLRIGFLHYNTQDEVARLLSHLNAITR